MKILFKFQVNQMKIDNFRNLADVDLLAYDDLLTTVDLKNDWWLNSMTLNTNFLQISRELDGN